MKPSLTAIVCVSLIVVCMQTAYSLQDVGGDFGTSWLGQHGSQPGSAIETEQNLWNWGATPKGYEVLNGILYPPGYWPQFYNPSFPTGADPIVINNTKTANYVSPSLQTSNSGYEDPWLLSQLSGRPVAVVNIPRGTLF